MCKHKKEQGEETTVQQTLSISLFEEHDVPFVFCDCLKVSILMFSCASLLTLQGSV